MDFDLKFPNAKHGEEVCPGIIYHNHHSHCGNCGKNTHFIDLDFQCWICSEECDWELSRK